MCIVYSLKISQNVTFLLSVPAAEWFAPEFRHADIQVFSETCSFFRRSIQQVVFTFFLHPCQNIHTVRAYDLRSRPWLLIRQLRHPTVCFASFHVNSHKYQLYVVCRRLRKKAISRNEFTLLDRLAAPRRQKTVMDPEKLHPHHHAKKLSFAAYLAEDKSK